MKIETKDEVKSEVTEKKSSSGMQIEKPEGSKESGGNFSAEDIVEEITELTSSNSDPNKAKRNKQNPKKPVKIPSEEPVQQKPSPLLAPKVYAVSEENEAVAQHHNEKNENEEQKTGDNGEGIQVISSDESPERMQEEVIEKPEEGNPETNPQ